jgi:hypothetical protein
VFYIIEGRRYEAMHPKTFSLNVLRDIKSATGLAPSELGVLVERLQAQRDLRDILDDEGALLGFSVLIWASRRAVGEQITMEQACDFDLANDFSVELTDAERLVADGRKVPGDRAAPDPRKARSRTKSPADKRTGRKATAKRSAMPGPSTT